jgi:membrane-bound lytic murein transglycosylase A
LIGSLLKLTLLCLLLAIMALLQTKAQPTPPSGGLNTAAAPNLIELDALPGWQQENFEGLGDAMALQCRRPQLLPASVVKLCGQLPTNASPQQWRQWLSTHFVARRQVNSAPIGEMAGQPEQTGLITGYYEPILTGSLLRESPTQVPALRLPSSLIPNTAPWSRAAIELRTFAQEEVLVWLDDPIEAFFMQVQGSGVVNSRLPDGAKRPMRLGFAGHNGFDYVAIGRSMLQAGELTHEQVSAPGIKQALRQNPAAAAAIMQRNPRYVFFRELQADTQLGFSAGPIGSLGVPLSGQRSVAVDPAFVPLGSLLWVDSVLPSEPTKPWQQLLLAQDTGGAIKGAIRVDVFWGRGDHAEHQAGLARYPGRVWVLVPR